MVAYPEIDIRASTSFLIPLYPGLSGVLMRNDSQNVLIEILYNEIISVRGLIPHTVDECIGLHLIQTYQKVQVISEICRYIIKSGYYEKYLK